jgi:hypothetical protein
MPPPIPIRHRAPRLVPRREPRPRGTPFTRLGQLWDQCSPSERALFLSVHLQPAERDILRRVLEDDAWQETTP